MLDGASALKGFKLHCLDGELGSVMTFYFDDRYWTIRYVVANTGDWIEGRQVLISPHALTAVSRERHHISVNLTRKQIESSPSLDSAEPISRRFEKSYHLYFGWPRYWGAPFTWGSTPYIARDDEEQRVDASGEQASDPHLRSTNAVTGYHVAAKDGEIGHVVDFLIDDETWAIRYLVVDTRNWWPGKQVMVAPKWIECLSVDQSKAFVALSRDQVKQSPAYASGELPRQVDDR
jgi:hypothetical protein